MTDFEARLSQLTRALVAAVDALDVLASDERLTPPDRDGALGLSLAVEEDARQTFAAGAAEVARAALDPTWFLRKQEDRAREAETDARTDL